jgi:3-hydroxymyristoyl/3-hydroxydecanoyl-(acyl carrier protein) dehydratase
MRFHLIDRIISYEKWNHVSGLKNITFGDELLEINNGVYYFPNTLLCESLLQTIAWLIVKSSDKKKAPSGFINWNTQLSIANI